jgi:endonuclease/exonuclease/phosphatase family metal-dependent hydrolase
VIMSARGSFGTLGRQDERDTITMANRGLPSKRRLRVVVWNVAGKQRAWAALDGLDADICLLNEAIVPAGRRGVWSADGTVGRDKATRRWTAAVVTRFDSAAITDARPKWRQSKRSVPFQCSRPGSWVAARIETGLGGVSAVALYGLMDEFSDASVHRSLSELSPVIDDPKYSEQVILGGDLNTGTQWPAGDPFNKRDRNVLDRLEALGLVDCIRAKRAVGRLTGCPCIEGENCSHVRTRRDAKRPSVPYQTDYLFASQKLAARLVSCASLATDEWFAISDHAPILAEFEL